MKTFLVLLSILAVSAPATKLESAPAQGAPSTILVRFPCLPLPAGARIVGASLSVRGAFVIAVDRIPLGWSLSLSMNPSCCPELTAGFHHSAEALSAGEPLDLAVTLQRFQGWQEPVQVTGGLDYTIDFVEFKNVPLSMQQLILSPQRPVPGA
jgi:hypothetical protein